MRAEPLTPAAPLIEAHGLALAYAAGPVVLDRVEFELRGGERLALLGPNGGGKTTLLRALLGQLRPRAGELIVGASCGSVPQTERSRLDYPVSALEVAAMGALSRRSWWRLPGRAGREEARAALARVGLEGHAEATFGELSGGQRQRVLIARALVQDARVLLMDEPFTGLDRPAAERLEALIAELAGEGHAIVMATHDLEQARRWDSVLCVNRRQIVIGPPAAVLDVPVLEATYGGAIVELPDGSGRAVLPAHHHHDH
jgi:ABC-type Mn2+/Zn2+ transport system ATPase subunit